MAVQTLQDLLLKLSEAAALQAFALDCLQN
jgi:hypothetical protein